MGVLRRARSEDFQGGKPPPADAAARFLAADALDQPPPLAPAASPAPSNAASTGSSAAAAAEAVATPAATTAGSLPAHVSAGALLFLRYARRAGALASDDDLAVHAEALKRLLLQMPPRRQEPHVFGAGRNFGCGGERRRD